MFHSFLNMKHQFLAPVFQAKLNWVNGLVIAWSLSAGFAPSAVAATEPRSYRSETRAFVAEMADKHGFDAGALQVLMARARYRQDIIDAMRRPYEAKPWSSYRPIFLTRSRIQGGAAFWLAHADLLERAQRDYGVPPEIIVAIVGVETGYGGNLGRHRVIDALSTLGFAYPPRAEFFRGELESFLLLGRDEGIDVPLVKGSYAGALGKPQFIPSSYRTYAVDFDGDGRRDLWRSDADVIGSVANYLHQHGWRPDQPVAVPAVLSPAAHEALSAQRIKVAEKRPVEPLAPVEDLTALGVVAAEPLDPEAPASLLRLDGPEDEYWLSLNNFYVITRYNHSNLYAMAVYQLAREIRASYLAKDPRKAAVEPPEDGS